MAKAAAKERVSANAARQLLLGAQGLLEEPARRATPKSLQRSIEALGFVPLAWIGPGDQAVVVLAASCIGIGHGAGRVLSMSSLAEAADEDAARTGEAKEGLYFAASTFVAAPLTVTVNIRVAPSASKAICLARSQQTSRSSLANFLYRGHSLVIGRFSAPPEASIIAVSLVL